MNNTLPKVAADFASTAATLVSGDRERTHGDKLKNFDNIARLWDAYMIGRKDTAAPINAEDVGHMMILIKLARTQSGAFNPDDYIDMCGYAACSGEVATRLRPAS